MSPLVTRHLYLFLNNILSNFEKHFLVAILTMRAVECNRCNKVLNSLSTLNRHIKNVHQEIPTVTAYPKQSSWSHHCLEENCDSAFASNKALIEHLTVNHNKEFHTEYLLMDDMEVFQAWKSKIERESGCYYVSKGKFNSPSGETRYYYCNRSKTGYTKKEERSRNEKSQGSCKLEYSCTSQIKVIQEETGVVVEWQKVHYGHTIDLRHLRLSKAEKQYIISKLEKGETPTSIVQSLHNHNKEGQRRLHLLTVNDIKRIKRGHGIKSENQLEDNKLQQNRNEARNFWVESVFSREQHNENMTKENINDDPLANASMYQDNSICGALQSVKEELGPQDETSSQILYNCSDQDSKYNESNQIINFGHFNNCSQTDQEQSRTIPEVTVFDTKPILIRQVRDMLSNLRNVNFEDLADPILNQVHQHLSSMTVLLGLNTELDSNDKIDPRSVDGVFKKDDCIDERNIMDVEGNSIEAPEDSIILIVEDDSRTRVTD